jgi:hypothetical protein
VPVIVQYNKQDIHGCLTPRDVEACLQSTSKGDRPRPLRGKSLRPSGRGPRDAQAPGDLRAARRDDMQTLRQEWARAFERYARSAANLAGAAREPHSGSCHDEPRCDTSPRQSRGSGRGAGEEGPKPPPRRYPPSESVGTPRPTMSPGGRCGTPGARDRFRASESVRYGPRRCRLRAVPAPATMSPDARYPARDDVALGERTPSPRRCHALGCAVPPPSPASDVALRACGTPSPS